MRFTISLFFLIIIALTVTSCIDGASRLTLKPVTFSSLPGWKKGDNAGSLKALRRSCKKFSELPAQFDMGIAGKRKDWDAVCKAAAKAEGKDAYHFFERHFTPYKAVDRRGTKALFTGYFEIELEGSRKKTEEFKYPLYRVPDPIAKPCIPRARIERGALLGQGLEMVYVKDPVRLFFLHIQGSGHIRLRDGSIMRVGYNGQNGCKYVSVGRVLIDRGEIPKDKMSAQAIKKWLYEHPEEMHSTMNENPSYIFFRKLTGDGPIGGQGVALTPEHSLAVDKRYIPYGVPLWLDTTLPGNDKPYRKLMIAQDTGGAIKGPLRGDVFFGAGERAEHIAGHMQQEGDYYLLFPKGLKVR